MMRVVLAATVTVKGGVWRHLVDLAGGLQQRGCDVRLALPEGAWDLRAEAAGMGLPVQGLVPRPPFDIWHLHLADTYERRALGALLAARRTAAGVIITEHLPRSNASDPSENSDGSARSLVAGPAKTAFKRAQYALCDQVVCVSEASVRFVETRYGLGQDKAVAIPNGIDLKALPAAWPQGPPLFVAIGAVIAQKGFEVLLDAAARARVPWRAEVIGEGPHRAALAARADRSELPVHFSGPCAEVGSAIDAATALVVPSHWEAWPYVAMEAMERARPVVASRVDGLSEIVADGTSGLLVSPGDAQALAAALDRLAGDPALASMLGRAGRERVLSFRLDGMVEGLLGVYEKALGAHRHRLPVGSGR